MKIVLDQPPSFGRTTYGHMEYESKDLHTLLKSKKTISEIENILTKIIDDTYKAGWFGAMNNTSVKRFIQNGKKV